MNHANQRLAIMKSVLSYVLFGLLVLGTQPLFAQQADLVDEKIREEGMERSQIMQTLHHLTDLHGPRLTGSPSLERAGTWALEQLTAWGLENAHPEPWDWGYPGWENERLSAHMTAPVKVPLVTEALAWTPGTDGPLTGEAVYLPPPDQPTQDELDAYLAEIQPTLEGKIILLGEMAFRQGGPGRSLRRDDEEVARMYEPTNMSEGRRGGPAQNTPPSDRLSDRAVQQQVSAFVADHGAALRVSPGRMNHGLVRAFSAGSYNPEEQIPSVVMRNEDYGRITRLMASGHSVTLEFDIVNTLYPEGRTAYNYVAEIPGSEKPDEVIMLGGHLDSWHAATGATDNAAGVAIMMEAVRILKALDLRPRRTIRIALWTGEEQGLLGSQAYVAEHFGTFEDPKPAFEAFGGYINIDSGTGRLRGATVFGPVEAAQVLEDILAPFEDLGVAGARPTTSRRLGGSDHTSFNRAGLPGISMGQDPIEYGSHTWHTNLDTYERIFEDDVKQAAVVVAAMLYHLGTRDALLPRVAPDDMPSLSLGSN